nr:retrovirus-related Pol polyprotein from transposon TNT 1-94 [Tanacetum cinerariifolium]
MVVKTIDVEKDPFRPLIDDEEILGLEVPYLSAIGALLFLASHTRPDISFSLNLLARYSSCPIRRHWNGVKQIFFYLQEILAIHEASREFIWLRSVIQHIHESCRISSSQEAVTIEHEDNATSLLNLRTNTSKDDVVFRYSCPSPSSSSSSSLSVEDLVGQDKFCYDSDIKAINILLLGLLVDIYTLINHYQTSNIIPNTSINDDMIEPHYDSDILAEVPHYETYHDSDMLKSNIQ